ncbi:pyridoxal phosphate-dependent transferase [Tricladium varicosporioides]|nr:pyridoxal phosphate-dependent transferase [Hymenoscyphus varicosporioides]
MTQKVRFGHKMREAHFGFSPSYTPLNHGSYGTSPLPVIGEQRRYQQQELERPTKFIIYDLPPLIDQARTAVAPLLGVRTDEVVFIPNATTGINIILRNLKFEQQDVIVHFSTIYAACEKTIASVAEIQPLEARCIELEYPISDEEIVRRLRETIEAVRKEGKNAKIAMFDTVLTFPGARMPWEELVRACREMGVLSLIDGAHGVGMIDLTHVGDVGPDFFVTNCHKWLFTPRGSAIFHVPLRNQHLIRTSIPTGHGYSYPSSTSPSSHSQTPFTYLFEFVATQDWSPYISVPSALKFREEQCGGEDSIRSYCFDLARTGGEAVAKILETDVMATTSPTAFTNVRLPISSSLFGDVPRREWESSKAGTIKSWLNRTALEEHDTYLQIGYHAGSLWVRLSGQIYLELSDFEWVGGVLKELCGRVEERSEE